MVTYTLLRRGVSVRKDTVPEPSVYEVGWPVPLLPPGTHLLLGEQLASIQPGHQVGLEP